jgi:hypothetical protein
MLYNYILTFRTNVLCKSVVGGLCDSPSSHPREQYIFPCLARSQSISLGLRLRCLQSHGTRNSAWVFCRHLGSTTQPMCVWSAACHEVQAYLNAARAEALTLSCPRPVEAYLCVHAHLLRILQHSPPSTCVLSGHRVIVISENIFPETLCLLCTECWCVMWCIHFYILWRRPLLSIPLLLGISSATADDLW